MNLGPCVDYSHISETSYNCPKMVQVVVERIKEFFEIIFFLQTTSPTFPSVLFFRRTGRHVCRRNMPESPYWCMMKKKPCCVFIFSDVSLELAVTNKEKCKVDVYIMWTSIRSVDELQQNIKFDRIMNNK